ncbi:MAG: hypothetical protein AAGU78_10620 [Chloroflexota bacterium]|jgi:hypothetical protein|nr:hypothetical protein [Anaerolineae bacterium]HMM26854.1 hypothetical protein [Aggregatilineaceae bacterium]
MWLEFMTPDVWNGLVLAVVIIGLALAALRIYRDLSRPKQGPRRPPPAAPKPAAPPASRSRRSKRRR